MQKTCPKCRRIITPRDPSQEECPRCGIVYAKYEHYLAAQKAQVSQQDDDKSLEDRIIDEIHKRVLDKEQKLQEEKVWELRTQATVEALQEVTDLPVEQVSKIAKNVRREIRKEETVEPIHAVVDNHVTQFKKKVILALAAIILCVFVGEFGYSFWKYSKISTQIVTTSGLKNYRPQDHLEEFALSARKVYFWVSFKNLSKGSYEVKMQIVDSEGNSDVACSGPLYVRDESKRIWCNFSPGSLEIEPGIWMFEVYLDGKQVAAESRTVLSDSSVGNNQK
ncbi:MAG: hypothetical protein GY801_02115 [bacterium]|nr:hypothetical protein [bacterium]